MNIYKNSRKIAVKNKVAILVTTGMSLNEAQKLAEKLVK